MNGAPTGSRHLGSKPRLQVDYNLQGDTGLIPVKFGLTPFKVRLAAFAV